MSFVDPEIQIARLTADLERVTRERDEARELSLKEMEGWRAAAEERDQLKEMLDGELAASLADKNARDQLRAALRLCVGKLHHEIKCATTQYVDDRPCDCYIREALAAAEKVLA